MNRPPYRTGMEVLLDRMADRLTGRRIGLVAHAASVNAGGIHSVELLRHHADIRVQALFSPEHGFDGKGRAGESIADSTHHAWNLPIRSLYGDTRHPTRDTLDDIDILVFDLQDIGVRCYTYVSTLRYVLEAAAECNLPLIVTDRPSPLSGIVDGPLLDPSFESFVGSIPAPFVYGMTPGETSRWLSEKWNRKVELDVAPMQGYRRGEGATPWAPPSPAIRSKDCALLYPATVFTEALPQFACDRSSGRAFRVLTGVDLDGDELARRLSDQDLPGIRVEAVAHGVWFHISDIEALRPVELAVHLIRTLQDLLGTDRVGDASGVRPAFFERLYGTDRVRTLLQSGASARSIIDSWRGDLAAFLAERETALLY